MSRQLFLRILGDLESVYAFFQQQADARDKPGYSTMQKCTAAIRQLAYGTVSDAMEEYLQMSATVAREVLHTFCEFILEAAASFDLWIWHAFFRTPGANNDIDVINASPIFDRLTDGVSPDISFSTNDVNYEYGYYLVDSIYPEWAMLVHSFTFPTDEKRQYFKKKHESARKDIERAFGDSGGAVCQGEYNDEPEPICTLNEDEKLANLLKTRKKGNEFQPSIGFG
ncbi:uncharacterized protein LOC143613159 [Bidens hawaiensis]|uniref:uncharacterized protein LOC143613159 n=1 Tax=Bidens hawaiensis TaxID=980011 RepID=UPI004049FA4A